MVKHMMATLTYSVLTARNSHLRVSAPHDDVSIHVYLYCYSGVRATSPPVHTIATQRSRTIFIPHCSHPLLPCLSRVVLLSTMRVQALLVLVVVVCAAVLPSYVYSWGDTGHSLTARLAMSLFSDKTAALMKEIVPDVRGDISQVSVASWPDTIRCATCPYPYTAAYHTGHHPIAFCTLRQRDDRLSVLCCHATHRSYCPLPSPFLSQSTFRTTSAITTQPSTAARQAVQTQPSKTTPPS